MFFFGWEESGEWENFCGDGFFEFAAGVEGVAGGFGEHLLVGVVVEDGGGVLGAAVSELATFVGGIDLSPENVKELLVGDLGRVIVDLD